MLSRLKLLRSANPQILRAQFLTSTFKSVSTLDKMTETKAKEAKLFSHNKVTFPRVIHQREYKYTEGKVYHGFRCERVDHISDFELTSYTLRHEGTGMELWHIDRSDANKVFSISFRTTPFDSTGLPHILEHLVLCGSKRYPVRDPFFKMLNRSVATFMNAMTGPDYTIYPFSTMNEIDYRNLQHIYLDAVFRPNLKYLDFLQEGWRLENKDIHDRDTQIVIKGVVYNEMKGAFAENAQVFGQNLLNNILPDHTYKHVSGGNPLEIPKLTHTDLVDFHRKYYHPSNSRVFSYGLLDLSKTLAILDKDYLSDQRCIDSSYSLIPPQERWIQPRNVHISSRLDNMGATINRQNQIAIALLMCDATNIQESFELHVLSEILIRGPNSVFYKNLIEPNFSGGYNQSTGYSSDTKDTAFVVGLQDLRVEDFTKFIELFDKTIFKAMNDGFESQHVESVLHNLELSLKHQSPFFGNTLLFNSTALWNYEGDVVSNLRVTEMISRLRESLSHKKTYFQDKIKQYFVNNNHRLTLTMSADELYEENFKQAEFELLNQKVKSLDKKKLKKIHENGLILDAFQKAKPNTEVLPCLSINDVSKPPKLPKILIQSIQNVQTQICKVSTNDITYFKCLFNITDLSQEETLLVPLFCSVISALGTGKYNYREFDTLVFSKTGGIDFKLNLIENVEDAKSYGLSVMMSSHALDKNVPDMFGLCQELFHNFKFDDSERVKMLIENYISNISVGVASSGHLYAMLGATALVSNAGKLKSLLSGVDHIEFMKNFVQQTNMLEICDKLRSIGTKIFNKNNMRGAINSTESYLPSAINHYRNFLQALPEFKKTNKISMINFYSPSCQQYVMNIPVNYCAKAFFTVPYMHQDHPSLRVLAKFVSTKYLLPLVREQNGAYGAGAKISSDGIFSFYSYRDPHSTKTLDAFEKTYEWLRSERQMIDPQSIFEAKLGVLQQLDSPIAPGNIGVDNFIYEVSQENFEKYRSGILSVTIDDLLDTIEKYFRKPPNHYGKCILGPANKQLELETSQKWKIIN
ncbi:presequence protease, mitochondrial [Drosophila rhopaloa]|uniref:Peptidase M16C associated domain-containing protein n=1 Tax=Drosophila rhopaloa TaxID=1041015 RepID=A0ABM5J3Q0_DRORH|nr:presequence protease, mitochondrial [Drosophila rhopaloa]XP_044313444.1 presequence protease, mitochondrial [Drosophila rhopaloa]XP_044313445.1 presequence protease, mitochondrial [Drosophila rhopaloa]